MDVCLCVCRLSRRMKEVWMLEVSFGFYLSFKSTLFLQEAEMWYYCRMEVNAFIIWFVSLFPLKA